MSVSLRLSLDQCRRAPFVVDVLQDADRLSAAAYDGGPAAVTLLAEAVAGDDELTAVAAVHALSAVFDDGADAVLSELLSHPRAFLREHACWALQSRLPRLDAIGRLVAVVLAGGFSGFLAQRTLARWASAAPDHVALALEGALGAHREPVASARLVETLGRVPGVVAGRVVRQLAADPRTDPTCRLQAVAALGDRLDDPTVRDLVCGLSTERGDVGAVARLSAHDLALDGVAPPERGPGLTVAQLFLHADIDRGLSRAGAGDTGGIATLLVRLGDALAGEAGVGRVLTLSRGSSKAALHALAPTPGHQLVPVPLLWPSFDATDAWPVRVAAERGIRRVLRAHCVDVLHLRMADVGSLAAAEVARGLDIPVVFTLAPDPHAMIHVLDVTGGLRRDNFGAVDEREHYWFRARLVQRLAAQAAHTVLLPRPRLRHDLRELLGVDVTEQPSKFTVVPEGIDLRISEQAAADVAVGPGAGGAGRTGAHGNRVRASAVGERAAVVSAGVGRAALAELDALVAALPADRQGLPLTLSVGRLHRVKGMATLVQAWAGDPGLRERCNLLIVGGDLDHPSRDEREQLDLIADAVRRSPSAGAGLLLPGHRPNDVVARWLAAAYAGRLPAVAPGGAYVCASLKEEFGLALLEALAAGLVVVGPLAGGPATYLEDAVTGVLVDTSSAAGVADGMRAALDLAARPAQPARVRRARQRIRADFTVQAMARTLGGVYCAVARPVGRP